MRRDHPDGNAKELLAALAADGWLSIRIARANDHGTGIPDAVVAKKGGRKNHFLEIKRLGGKLRESQVAFAHVWPSCIHVATSSFEARLLLEECEARS